MNNRIRNRINTMIERNAFKKMSIMQLTNFLADKCPPNRKLIGKILNNSRREL